MTTPIDPKKPKNFTNTSPKLDNLKIKSGPRVGTNTSGEQEKANPLQSETPESTEDNFNTKETTETAQDFHINQDNLGVNQDNRIEDLENQILELKRDLESEKNQNLRLLADIQNLQKQNEIDLSRARKSTKKAVAEQLLQVLNTFYLAIVHVPKGEYQKLDDFASTLSQSISRAISDLKAVDIEILLPEIGSVFDPNEMELLNPSESDDLKIKQVVSIGIKIDGNLLRPVSVMV